MDIFSAINMVKKGVRCSSYLGDIKYILFLRTTQNYNYRPVREKKVLGAMKIKEGQLTSCVDLPAVVMCNTDWKVCGLEDEIEVWLSLHLNPIATQDSMESATKLLKHALEVLKKERK
jgi:hypothetical protein